MSIFAVLATGPSMSQELADSVRHLRRVVVSNAYLLAPDAEAMVANDAAWWRTHPEAMTFRGDRYCHADVKGTIRVPPGRAIAPATNSGLAALHVAIKRGARRVYLLGLDMKVPLDAAGKPIAEKSHYFGAHKSNPNPTPQRFRIFLGQFATYAERLPHGVEIFNATPGSALHIFPFADIRETFAETASC